MSFLIVLLVVLMFGLILLIGVVVAAVAVAKATSGGSTREAPPPPPPPAAVPIASVPEGAEVTVRGHVRALGPMLASPLSGEPLIAFRIVIEMLHRQQATSGTSSWKVAHVDEQLPELLLVDGSGEARVVPGPNTELESPSSRKESFGGLREASAAVAAYMARVGYVPPRFITVPAHRITELRLVEGDRVEVLGRARRDDAPASIAAGPRTQATRIVLEAGARPLRIRSGNV